MPKHIKKKWANKVDIQLLLIAGYLSIFGLVSLYSASTVESFSNFGTTTKYIIHQLVNGGLLGLAGMAFFYFFDYHLLKKFLPLMLLVTLAFLLLVEFSSLSFSAGGASRWLHIGPFNFQPSEIAKLTVVVYMAAWLEQKQHLLDNFWRGLMPSLLVVGLICFLILSQPDFGTMSVIVAASAIMIFCAGLKWRYLFIGGVVLACLLYLFVHFEPYRAERLLTFLRPEVDPTGISYQVNQSKLAIGAGSVFGYGYGLSRQKYNYLPESYTDSIFAVTAEELGFVGSVSVLLGFLFLVLKGIKIGNAAPDSFGRLLSIGLVSWLGIQAVVNVSALTGLVPLTGIPLPYFSYGSTALALNMAIIGILLNISKQS